VRLRFVDVGVAGEPYPSPLADLRNAHASGVYVLRSSSSREVLYVGESHAGRLYSTITRHLQGWGRSKGFWSRAGFSRSDPGVTYRRSDVEVAWMVLPDSRAVEAQNRLIRRLRPRDNVVDGPIDPSTWLPDIPF
jgi:hypothetical protein